MAQPPSYNRQKNFADDFGNETDHSALNAELDRASNSINDIRTNLAVLQADDGKLRPAVVTSDSISDELRLDLIGGVVMDAQAMLDRSLEAADASFASAAKAKASEETAKTSSVAAADSAREAAESAKAISLAVNSDWNANSGAAEILNKPELSDVALSGSYNDLKDVPVLYPVGSIYMSVNATDPATLFGGSWAQIENTFLLACGSAYAAGSSGGEASHVLTAAEMPEHTHNAWTDTQSLYGESDTGGEFNGHTASGICGIYAHNVHRNTDGAGDHSVRITVNATHAHAIGMGAAGSGAAHNNMPPYLAVYVWQRTA